MPTMSYPPSADHSIPTRRGAAARNSRPLSATSDMSFYPEESDAGNHSLSRSSADMYAQVPTSDGPAWDPTSPALYPLDSPDPNSPRPYGHSSPYDRSYSDNNMSGHGSTMNLSDDGDSQRNIYARGAMPRTASNLQYHDEPSEEVLASRVGVPTASEKARVNSSTRRSAMAGASAKGKPKGGFWSRLSSRARKFVIVGGILAIILIAVVVAVPAALLGHGKSNASAADTTSGAASTTVSAPSGVPTGVNGANWKTAAVGGDGSLVYLDDGSSFVYNNTFGNFPLLAFSLPEHDADTRNSFFRRLLERHPVQRLGSGSS